MTVPSYPSPVAIGHRSIAGLLDGPVVVQEKVDGSQISFCVDAGGELRVRSKGAQINVIAPDNMFSNGVEAIKAVKDKLTPGFVYRGEYLKKPKHNALAYDRVPKNHIALFDIHDRNKGEEFYCDMNIVGDEAKRLGFDMVPVFHVGNVAIEQIRGFLNNVSFLGGARIEGVVVKNYSLFTPDHKVAMGKFVSEAFKEVHSAAWKESNPTQKDVVERLIDGHRTPARWAKAVQHLREAGKLSDSPKDIGLIIKEAQEDVRRECRQDIADALVEYFLPGILRGVVNGIPEWYKEQLLISSLNAPSNDNDEVKAAA